MKFVTFFACAAALASGVACEKVPITDVNARFEVADVAWFAQEATMFVFYRVQAEQGLGPTSVVELTYRTDDKDQTWVPITQLPTVHTHVPVDCGPNARCGSTSLAVNLPPRQVGIRLRYHRDGEVTLDPKVNLNVIAAGPAHTNRSLLIYGVFDATNTRVQWRARHQFPTLRNEQVQALGLRRSFTITAPQYGEATSPIETNPYGYAFATTCPEGLEPLGWPALETKDRAVFDANSLPVLAGEASSVCASATVTDATGTFTAAALARKNAEVVSAFPTLRSPIRVTQRIGFLLQPCRRVINEAHRKLQIQRLVLQDAPQICIDDWQQPTFADELATTFRKRVDEVRAQGMDMVLAVALHHDDETRQFADVVERALQDVLQTERDKSTPRLAGAFVLDSFAYTVVRTEVSRSVLWCPANIVGDLDQVNNGASQACAVLPDDLELTLGPFGVANLPILPSRQQYLNFVKKYGEAQTGKVVRLEFRAPERTPLSSNVDLGDFGTGTFFNNETITAESTDSFSYCADRRTLASAVIFRPSSDADPAPLSQLPMFQSQTPARLYQVGLAWDFPFLLRMNYEIVIAGAVSAFSATAPFGLGVPATSYYGAELWQTEEFKLADVLLQCRRFCDHPTFDSAGVYNLNIAFSPNFASRCYRPRFPVPTDGGFPLDP
ncbi:MAG: hypothetical protein SF187_10075 [Deltaproteobacteria bacterium]|nr:hypothetical protein [Deltaproteobacteria bacterium]